MKNDRPDMGKRSWNLPSLAARVVLLVVVAAFAAGIDCGAVWSETELSVVVEGEVWVPGEKVYLTDIARLTGSSDWNSCIENTYLALSPDAGKLKTLHGSWIASKIRATGCLPENVKLVVPDYVRVGRAYQTIQDDTLERRFAEFVADHLNDLNSEFRVSRFRVVGNGPLPEGATRIELVPQTDKEFMGYVSLNATVYVENKIQKRLVLSGWIDRLEDVVCLRRAVDSDAVLSKDDLIVERKNVTRLPGKAIRSVEEAIGKRVKHSVGAGAVLLANGIERPPLIKKGDRVTIVAESSTLLVTASGIAQDQGSAGDQILVRNHMSDKDIIASVVDASTVKVEF
jgi:flagella basal body P-ring formation protein FlgA